MPTLYNMSTKWEDWDESFLDVQDYQVERAANNAALTAIRGPLNETPQNPKK